MLLEYLSCKYPNSIFSK